MRERQRLTASRGKPPSLFTLALKRRPLKWRRAMVQAGTLNGPGGIWTNPVWEDVADSDLTWLKLPSELTRSVRWILDQYTPPSKQWDYISDENHTMASLKDLHRKRIRALQHGLDPFSVLAPVGEVFHAKSKIGNAVLAPTRGASLGDMGSRVYYLWEPISTGIDWCYAAECSAEVGIWSYIHSTSHFWQFCLRAGVIIDPLDVRLSRDKLSGLGLARRNAVKAALPGIRDTWQLPLFIKELGDVKTLFSTFSRLCKILKQNARDPQRLFKLIGGYVNGTTTWEEISNDHLMIQFGLLPFVSDMCTAVRVIANFRKNLEAYKRNANRYVTVHCQEAVRVKTGYVFKETGEYIPSRLSDAYTQTWDCHNMTAPNGLNLWEPNTLYHTDQPRTVWHHRLLYKRYLRVRPETVKYHLTLLMTYTLPAADKLLEKMCLLDAFSVNLNPVQFWNAIPFSFIVDWVVDVSGFLESLGDLSWSKAEVTIHQASESLKYTWDRYLTRDTTPDDGGWMEVGGSNFAQTFCSALDDAVTDTPVASGSVYYRWACNGLPVTSWQGFRLPRGMQILNATALLVQHLGSK